jgi:hypothetical protein
LTLRLHFATASSGSLPQKGVCVNHKYFSEIETKVKDILGAQTGFFEEKTQR